MLDRTKLIDEMRKHADHLFPDTSAVSELAQTLWKSLAHDPTFAARVAAAQSSFLIPRWRGNLNDSVPINTQVCDYTVFAVDGSQIYPDRHISGPGCFLINTGGVVLSYGTKGSATLFSQPRIFFPHDFIKEPYGNSFSPDLVDLVREKLELEVAATQLETLLSYNHADNRLGCFVDGTLIFWTLEAKNPEVKALFLDYYRASLHRFFSNTIPIAGYISFPKSKEIINIIKLGLCRFSVANCILCHSTYTTFPCKAIDMLSDTAIVRSFLPPGHRTTLFMSCSKITTLYPEHLRPYFFYLNVGKEIARLEIPAWMVERPDTIDFICSLALNQSTKGDGYPICLAEAHEQAVVKGPDRQFFYSVIERIGLEKNRRTYLSEKSLKKRSMGV